MVNPVGQFGLYQRRHAGVVVVEVGPGEQVLPSTASPGAEELLRVAPESVGNVRYEEPASRRMRSKLAAPASAYASASVTWMRNA